MNAPKDITDGEWHVLCQNQIGAGASRIAVIIGDSTPLHVDDANARMMAASKKLAEHLNRVRETREAYDRAQQRSFLNQDEPGEVELALKIHMDALGFREDVIDKKNEAYGYCDECDAEETFEVEFAS